MLVMKFGGTSVGSAEAIRRVSHIVRKHAGRSPMVVVSAVSGVTNALLAAAEAARKRKRAPDAMVDELGKRHRDLLDELGLARDLVDRHLARLREVLIGIYYLRELTARSTDYVASFGELMSSEIVAAHFSREGLEAKAWAAWDAGVLTDDHHGEAEVLPETYTRIRRWSRERMGAALPVVTGFLGRDKDGERTTLGRGGSDYSASILGRGVQAEEIQIWTDVPGILSADPRIVSDAFTVRTVTFAEASELAFFGAKVLHPKTMAPAVGANIPIRVLNTFAPDDPGTVVVAELPEAERAGDRIVTGLAAKQGNALVNIDSPRMLGAAGYLAEVFDCLRRHDVSVDAIATSEVSISLTIDGRLTAELKPAVEDLKKIADVRLHEGRAVMCVVGEGMRVRPGVSGQIFSVLGRAGVNVEMISQGSSELNVTFVVKDADVEPAMKALHHEFLAPFAFKGAS